MKSLLVLVCLFSGVALAKPTQVRTLSNNSSASSGDHNVYAKIVPYGGGVGFGATYEQSSGSNFGFGGGILILPEKKNSVNDNRPSLLALVGNMFLHFPVDIVDFYVSPGFNLMMMEQNTDDKTTIGASLTLGTLAQVTDNVAVGLEFMAYHPWFNKEFYTAGRSYYTNSALTGRFTF
jgi:opacity protein-like surface antigen